MPVCFARRGSVCGAGQCGGPQAEDVQKYTERVLEEMQRLIGQPVQAGGSQPPDTEDIDLETFYNALLESATDRTEKEITARELGKQTRNPEEPLHPRFDVRLNPEGIAAIGKGGRPGPEPLMPMYNIDEYGSWFDVEFPFLRMRV